MSLEKKRSKTSPYYLTRSSSVEKFDVTDLIENMERKAHLLSEHKDAQHGSPIWKTAIELYFEEMRKGGTNDPTIDTILWSVNGRSDLLQHVKALVQNSPRAPGTWVESVHRLRPILLSLNDFTAVIAWSLGLNYRLAAII